MALRQVASTVKFVCVVGAEATLLAPVLAGQFRNAKRRAMHNKLRIRLTPQQKEAFRAFEDTDKVHAETAPFLTS